MADTLNVTVREHRGSRNAHRDRVAGKTPAVLYGHGKETVCLSVPSEELAAAIRHGGQVVDLEGAVKETAVIREVQWDAFGIDVLHIDLTRVSRGEKIEVTVNVELRGEAPGTKEGGIIILVTHEIEIECPVMSVPDKLVVNINSLKLDEEITAAELTLPEGASLISDGDAVIVQCIEPAEEEEEEAAAEISAEPEVIGEEPEEEKDE